jgi:hypothetical protein
MLQCDTCRAQALPAWSNGPVGGRRGAGGGTDAEAPHHSITTSVMANNVGGVVSPRSLAAFRLKLEPSRLDYWRVAPGLLALDYAENLRQVCDGFASRSTILSN